MSDSLPKLDEECFFIAPIGTEGGETRERSDGVMEYIVGPAAEIVGLTTIRADKIAKPGQITRQVIEHVAGAKAAVVDLTGENPNVYYEMAVRHTAQLPTVLISQVGEKLPFDISQMRTIFFDHTSLKSAAECRDQIAQHLREALDGEVDSPIAASVTVQRLEQGSPQDRVLAQLLDGMDELRKRVARMSVNGREGSRDVHHGALRDLERGLDELFAYQDLHGPSDPALERAVRTLEEPIAWLSRGRKRRSGFLDNWRGAERPPDEETLKSSDESEVETGDPKEAEPDSASEGS